MTCGQYPKDGHKAHVCVECTDLGLDCEAVCRRGESCNFKPKKTKKTDTELKTIKDIKGLALRIKDKIPPEWNEKFIEVDA